MYCSAWNYIQMYRAEKRRPSLNPGLKGVAQNRDQRIVPISFRLTGIVLNALSRINNDWAAEQLSRVWFRVFKSRPKHWVTRFWSQADNCIEVSLSDKLIPVYCWGKGPLVVFMHGWSGSGTQFRHFIPELVKAGFRVALFDAPGHGQNPGKHSHLLEFSDSLLAIQNQIAPIHAVVAHSLGAMAATLATHRGLSVNQLVLMAPHLDVNEMFDSYSQLLGLNEELRQCFRQRAGNKMDKILCWDPWSLLLTGILLKHDEIDGLLAFDRHDEEVPSYHFKEIQGLWKQAEIVSTEGLGHVRLLKDQAVIGQVVKYLQVTSNLNTA